MLLIGLTSLLIAAPLYSVTITPTLLTRITSIIFIFSATLSFNSLYMQAINSGIGLYSGLFQVTTVTQFMEIFLYVIAACILLGYAPQVLSDTLSFPGGSSYKSAIYNLDNQEKEKVNTAREKPQIIAEYPLILLFTIIGASFLISSADLISMYLSIELQSFAVYILASVYRDSESATSAGLKYFLLGALSSALILLGSSLIYAYTGLTHFEGISMISNSQIGAFAPSIGDKSVIYNQESGNISAIYSQGGFNGTDDFSKGVVLGILIIGVGFLFKVAAAPFHSWAPDVYDGVPTIVTTWLTIMPKISLFIFLLAFLFPFFSCALMGEVKYLLLATSLLSLVIGTVVGLAQSRIKRLLAFSTISHVGFLLLALSVNSEDSITSFIFYLMQYSITNLNAFFVILAFGYVLQLEPAFALGHSQSTIEKGHGGYNDKQSTIALLNLPFPGDKSAIYHQENLRTTHVGAGRGDKDITFISQLKGQFSANPLLGLSFAVCLFSMAGIPPLLGFFAKYLVLYSAIESGYYFLALIGILASVVSAAYYLRIIRVIHFDLSLVSAPFQGDPGSGDQSSIYNQESLSYTSRKSDALIAAFAQGPQAIGEKPPLTSAHSYVIAVLTISIIFFILSPSLFLNSCNLLALSLFTA